MSDAKGPSDSPGAAPTKRTLLVSIGAAVGTAVVRKIRSPHTTGDECPLPGTVAFHLMPSVSLHRRGAAPTAMPSAFGPRQYAQSPSAAIRTAPAQAKAHVRRVRSRRIRSR